MDCRKRGYGFKLFIAVLLFLAALFAMDIYYIDIVYYQTQVQTQQPGSRWGSVIKVMRAVSRVGRVHTILSEVEETYNYTIEPFTETTSTQSSIEDTTEVDLSNETTTTSTEGSILAAILHTNNFLIGAGAVLGERWIIATAFQMGAFQAEQLQVRVGSESPTAGGQLVQVIQIFSHPMFRHFNNDVALLKTADTIVLDLAVRLIPVASSPPSLGDPGDLVSWNTSAEESYIQKVPADVVPVSECRAFYPDFELTDSNICVVMDQELPFEVTLYGSPLVFNNTLVGLYMGLEANTAKPYLCSSLSPLIGWIHLTMSNETNAQRVFPLDD